MEFIPFIEVLSFLDWRDKKGMSLSALKVQLKNKLTLEMYNAVF